MREQDQIKKRIILQAQIISGETKERRASNALEFSALLFGFLFVIEFMMCYSWLGSVGDRVLLGGVLWRLRMLVHGGFTHYPGPAASWGANQDDRSSYHSSFSYEIY